ncbi:hypothetical protein [Nocardioides pinisoli]|uniref:Uncharacterized protein n=1 Tax=Nocardioides pinisoli TaxID=2950279 RepID=A0ABT1L074_9ACTN|nr:hypothetical protein [Nocardioides pinisoli]MCP3422979.1 hypothetical protein [Nocardioides pinisoli]
MSHFKASSRTDLIVRVETDTGADALGWVIGSCEHSLVLHIDDTGHEQDGWTVIIPWDRITDLADVTEFMTVGPAWAQALV